MTTASRSGDPAPGQLPDTPIVSPRPDVAPFRPTMVHEWNELTFLHWSYEPDVIQRLLPPGLTVDTYGGRAWVGLVPFLMVVRPPRGPEVPWLSRFCETNVRTYVKPDAAPDDRGVWFLSLDATRLPAVATARGGYGLPYFWSAMTLSHNRSGAGPDHSGDEMTYTCRRRWPGPRGASSRVGITIDRPYLDDELGGLDHFLTARWRLFMYRPHVHLPGRPAPLRYALARHEPWPLYRATVTDLDDHLMTAAGLPAPVGEPLVHWSPGTTVDIGLPRRVGTTITAPTGVTAA